MSGGTAIDPGTAIRFLLEAHHCSAFCGYTPDILASLRALINRRILKNLVSYQPVNVFFGY
jgi:hypothetical protein